MESTTIEKVQANYRVPRDLKRRLKIRAAEVGCNESDLATEALREYLRRNASESRAGDGPDRAA